MGYAVNDKDGPIRRPKITFGSLPKDRQTVRRATDNGAGFNMKFVDTLFLPCRRLHTSAQFPGAGIGLSVADRIIGRHRGRIRAEEKEDEGATVYFTIHTED